MTGRHSGTCTVVAAAAAVLLTVGCAAHGVVWPSPADLARCQKDDPSFAQFCQVGTGQAEPVWIQAEGPRGSLIFRAVIQWPEAEHKWGRAVIGDMGDCARAVVGGAGHGALRAASMFGWMALFGFNSAMQFDRNFHEETTDADPERQETFDGCLRARGYHVATKPEPSTTAD